MLRIDAQVFRDRRAYDPVMMPRRALLLLLSALGALGCSRSPPRRQAPAEPPRPTAVDEAFRAYESQLPEPQSLSEQNGATLACSGSRSATLTLLGVAAKKVRVERDADLVGVARWARHEDPCLRHIALEVILPRIGYDRSQLSVPPMHDPEHYAYHDIFFSLKAHLDRARVAYDAKVFEGMMLDVKPTDFSTFVRGTWIEEIDGKGFQELLEVDGEHARVTSKHLPPDPKWPDTTQTTKIARVASNERGQLVLTGAWSVESNSAGYTGPKNEPAAFVLSFWPVRPDVMWFKNGEAAYWVKMKRAPR